MNPRRATARIGIIRHPHVATEVLLQNEDMTAPGRNHSWRRRRPRKAQPVRGQIQFRNDATKHAQGSSAAAERRGASGRTPANNPVIRDNGRADCIADVSHRHSGRAIGLQRVPWRRFAARLRIREVTGHDDVAFGGWKSAIRPRFGDGTGSNKEDARRKNSFDHRRSLSWRSCPAREKRILIWPKWVQSAAKGCFYWFP